MIEINPKDFIVLVVDDTSRNLQLVVEILDNEGYGTTFASNGKQAIERVKKGDIDLILLDLMMPEIGGIEVCQILKKDAEFAKIPIIFLTASNEKDNIIRAFESGAVDYVTKPFYSRELLARVRTHLELKTIYDHLEKANAELQRTASIDYLTGVPNRRTIFTFAQKEFDRSARYQRNFSVLVMDIDHFKYINDTFGHLTGDRVLIAVAQTIQDCLRKVDGFGHWIEGKSATVPTETPEDSFGRWGGEEFVAILPETPLEEGLIAAERIRHALTQLTIDADGRAIRITISVGVAGVRPGDAHIEEVIERADQALLLAKRQGRNRVIASEE
jgi:PleD family two-component response regulator